MIVPYSQLPSIKSRVFLVPLLPITFTHGLHEISTLALVDSGAAGAVISTVIADELGIDWHNIKMDAGFSVGGTFRSHTIEEVIIEVLNQTFPLKLSIVEGIGPYTYILGQADIFQKAKITFESYKEQFTIDFRKYN